MADFNIAFEKTLLAEGGYKLTDIANDRGGQTYAGIARKANPNWLGWNAIDAGGTPPSELVRQFYKLTYWDSLRCDSIINQSVAESIYDFGVNAGVKTSAKLAQIVVGVTPDGVIGQKSLMAINSMKAEQFRPAFSLAKIARYRDIVQRDKSQIKFLMGWLNRTLKDAA
jgi:lysozyme family protein